MELSSKLELIYILYNCLIICCLIFTLIYKGGTVDYSDFVISIWRLVYRSKKEDIIFHLEESTLQNLDLLIF